MKPNPAPRERFAAVAPGSPSLDRPTCGPVSKQRACRVNAAVPTVARPRPPRGVGSLAAFLRAGCGLLLTCALAVNAALAESPATRPARGDTLTSSVVIHAPAKEIFDCFRTPEGIVRSWGVAKAKVDFRVGGQIRTAYNPAADLDSDQVIVNTILAYEPNRMLAMKATPPAGAPDWLQAICDAGWSVITLEPIAPDRTRVTVTGMGYGPGPLFDTAYAFFEKGNAETLRLMQARLGKPPEPGSDRARMALDRFRAAAQRGGAWVARQTLNDRPFRARVEFRLLHDGKFVEARGSIGDDDALRPHALMVCGIDPVTGAAVFDQYMETGAIARGAMTLLDDDRTVASEWHFCNPPDDADAPGVRVGPPPQPWHVTYEFNDDDAFTLRLWPTPQPTGEPIMTIRYRHVGEE